MDHCVHVALDRFGAEAIAKAHELLETDSTRPRLVWAGLELPPTPSDYWDLSLPVWDHTLDWRHLLALVESGDEPIDLSGLAAGIRALLVSDKGQEVLAGVTGSVATGPREPTFVLVGALAQSHTCAILLGFQSALARLRRLGRMVHVEQVVLGVGAAAGDSGGRPEQQRARVAWSLFDIENWVSALRESGDLLGPAFLVGEHQTGPASTDRETQVAIAAAMLVALPAMGSVEWPISPAAEGPFAAVGAFVVSSGRERLARLLAVRACRESLELLARQDLFESLDAAVAQAPSADLALLTELEGQVLRALTGEPDTASSVALDPGAIDLLFGSLCSGRDWKSVLDAYGESRLKLLPLDDWIPALDDLREVVEKNVLVARRVALVEQGRVLIGQLLLSLDQSMQSIFERTFSAPIDATPNRIAQLLLGRIALRLDQSRRQALSVELAKPSGPTTDDLRQRAEKSLQNLHSCLEAIPSPMAVWLRVTPIVGTFVALVILLPLSFGFMDSLLSRFLAGLAIGGAVAAGLFLREVDLVRRRLFGEYRRWLSDYQSWLVSKDTESKLEARALFWDSAERLVQWYFSGESAEPPLPEGVRVRFQRSVGGEEPTADCLPRPRAVSSTSRFGEAAAELRDLERRFLADYSASAAEVRLPFSEPPAHQAVQREYGRFTSHGLAQLLREARAWARDRTSTTSPFMLFWDMPTQSTSSCHPWRRPLELTRSGFRYFETVKGYLLHRLGGGDRLIDRLKEHEAREGSLTDAVSVLGERYRSLAVPSLLAEGDVDVIVFAAAEDDPLASGLRVHGSLRVGDLSMHLQIKYGLGADDVINYPTAKQPETLLGRAWQAYRSLPQTQQHLTHVVLPSVDTP